MWCPRTIQQPLAFTCNRQVATEMEAIPPLGMAFHCSRCIVESSQVTHLNARTPSLDGLITELQVEGRNGLSIKQRGNGVILLRAKEPGARGGWNVTTGAAGRAQGKEKTISRVANIRRERAPRTDGSFRESRVVAYARHKDAGV